MLNQVFVFGFFHADLHPANIFVLPGDAIGYVDFGIVGQLPEPVRQSLTRYSWLLFRGDIEAAVTELMRWLAPTSSTDPDGAPPAAHRVTRRSCTTRPRRSGASGRPARSREPRTTPIRSWPSTSMQTIRDHQLTLSPSMVPTSRCWSRWVHCATSSRSTTTCRPRPALLQPLARQQRHSALDPRLAMDRLYAGAGQVQRALHFVDFLEGQEPTILEAESLLFGFRARCRPLGRPRAARRRSWRSAPCCTW